MERVLTSSQRKLSPMPTGPKGEKRPAELRRVPHALKMGVELCSGARVADDDQVVDHAFSPLVLKFAEPVRRRVPSVS